MAGHPETARRNCLLSELPGSPRLTGSGNALQAGFGRRKLMECFLGDLPVPVTKTTCFHWRNSSRRRLFMFSHVPLQPLEGFPHFSLEIFWWKLCCETGTVWSLCSSPNFPCCLGRTAGPAPSPVPAAPAVSGSAGCLQTTRRLLPGYLH